MGGERGEEVEGLDEGPLLRLLLSLPLLSLCCLRGRSRVGLATNLEIFSIDSSVRRTGPDFKGTSSLHGTV